MTLEELLLVKKTISKYEYDVFLLFSVNSLGSALLKEQIDHAFMFVPENLTEGELAFAEGQRAYVRDVKRIILRIQEMLNG